ncbi:ATP-binding protein [uncultured Rhodospira sp.]|uniref:sensor histidine kinase n=1 Tax=uncultured Rhodospira sp. TaxID=1936189 RepID=UPI0026057E4D|nr:ATP-binding protein [uncultured Rhodospira sp.]
MMTPKELLNLVLTDRSGVRYFRAIVFSVVAPFLLVVLTVALATFSVLTIEDVQDNSQRAISTWYKLDSATRRHFSIHDPEITHDAWVRQLDAFDRVLGDLRSGDQNWVLGEDLAERTDRLYQAWLATKAKLLEGDALFEDIVASDAGRTLSALSYSEVVRGAAKPEATPGIPIDQLWLIVRLEDSLTDLNVIGDVFEDILTRTGEDITQRVAVMWQFIALFSLVATISIVFLALFSAAVFTRDQRETEQALRHSLDDLQKFAYVASHDLREPLRMVASYIQLLERRLGAALTAETREYMGFIFEGAKRMDALLTDLLTFTRIDAASRPTGDAESEDALEDALDNLGAAIKETGALITYAGLPSVLANQQHLTQVFQNLVGNSLKYRRPDRVPEVAISATVEKGTATFRVADNGIGVEPQYHDRVFEIFQRLHSRDQYEGTGIGLAICKRIVERHGGRIWIESTLGNGATVCFTLPASAALSR